MAPLYQAEELTKVIVNDFNIGLVIWQLLTIIILIALTYSIVKLYKKLSRYLDSKK